MLNHFTTSPISRSKNESVLKRAAYICGKTVTDERTSEKFWTFREDVIWQGIFMPPNAPFEFNNLQILCNALEKAEKRSDARIARQYIASLPNELPREAIVEIAKGFIHANFVSEGLCVIAAVHEGRNLSDARDNNPHLHAIVSTRKVEPSGFSHKKYRVLDSKSHLIALRKRWTETQNKEYEKYHLPYRVSLSRDHDLGQEHNESKAHTR